MSKYELAKEHQARIEAIIRGLIGTYNISEHVNQIAIDRADLDKMIGEMAKTFSPVTFYTTQQTKDD